MIDRTIYSQRTFFYLLNILKRNNVPFFRAPLTMQDLKPNDELKAQINEWIKEKRRAYADAKMK